MTTHGHIGRLVSLRSSPGRPLYPEGERRLHSGSLCARNSADLRRWQGPNDSAWFHFRDMAPMARSSPKVARRLKRMMVGVSQITYTAGNAPNRAPLRGGFSRTRHPRLLRRVRSRAQQRPDTAPDLALSWEHRAKPAYAGLGQGNTDSNWDARRHRWMSHPRLLCTSTR